MNVSVPPPGPAIPLEEWPSGERTGLLAAAPPADASGQCVPDDQCGARVRLAMRGRAGDEADGATGLHEECFGLTSLGTSHRVEVAPRARR
jgi:hypothetical protein